MPLPTEKKFLSADEKIYLEPEMIVTKEHIGTKSKLKTIIKDLLQEVEELKGQKNDTSNLKNAFKQHIEDENANIGVLKTRLDAIEELVKSLITKVEDLENIDL